MAPEEDRPDAGGGAAERCRILHLEDSPADAELVAERLRLDGFAPEVERVETRRAFTEALARRAVGLDVILADYSLPDFDGVSALAIARELAPEIPFIFVSGTLGEETAIEAIKAGATDYVVKQRLGRLPVVIRRALAETAVRVERRAAEEALGESEARLRFATRAGRLGVWELDLHTGAMTASAVCKENFGRDPAAPFSYEALREAVHPDDRERMAAAVERSIGEGADYDIEYRVVRPDGAVGWVQVRAQVARALEDGAPSRMAGISLDVTERKRVEEDVRRLNETLEARVDARTAELMAAEATLHQAQKMEAVGQLTGGIAHDFNNMLQAIGGALELMQRRVERGQAAEAARLVEVARETVERAAALTHRLLAFARRQVLQPRVVEPDALVAGMAELIRRTVGPGVAVELRMGDGIWTVLCDPNQLENALLNLAVNARDAMREGGRLTIHTADVRLGAADVAGQEGAVPGEYVEVAVGDTGAGMDEATRARAFEPFFTTKPIGQGTGLGLSQLYGFARQSGGLVRLDSAPGRGTTVRLYLPRHNGDGSASDAEMSDQEEVRAGAGGTVLLVEDEESVRAVAAERLRELGYRVLEAENGLAALQLLRSGRRVDVLVTDVGLPGGMNGRQVADAVRERRPGLPVLFITGYAGGVLEGRLAPGMEVIGKPFALDALAGRIRAMLEVVPVR